MDTNQTIGQIVAEDFRKAAVFKHYGIDFCCGGGRTLSESCQAKGVNPQEVEAALLELEENSFASQKEYNEWSLSFLSDFIINNYHHYIERTVGPITEFAVKVARVHGERHPELIEVLQAWNSLREELLQHMMKEERILFPYIKSLEASTEWQRPMFGTAQNPIHMMEMEHETAGGLMARIADLTNHYLAPEGACTTYRVLFSMLQEFEEKLHEHVHLENNILFVKTLKREASRMN